MRLSIWLALPRRWHCSLRSSLRSISIIFSCLFVGLLSLSFLLGGSLLIGAGPNRIILLSGWRKGVVFCGSNCVDGGLSQRVLLLGCIHGQTAILVDQVGYAASCSLVERHVVQRTLGVHVQILNLLSRYVSILADRVHVRASLSHRAATFPGLSATARVADAEVRLLVRFGENNCRRLVRNTSSISRNPSRPACRVPWVPTCSCHGSNLCALPTRIQEILLR